MNKFTVRSTVVKPFVSQIKHIGLYFSSPAVLEQSFQSNPSDKRSRVEAQHITDETALFSPLDLEIANSQCVPWAHVQIASSCACFGTQHTFFSICYRKCYLNHAILQCSGANGQYSSEDTIPLQHVVAKWFTPQFRWSCG